MKYFIIHKHYGPWEGLDMIAIFQTLEEAKRFVRAYEDITYLLTITEYEMEEGVLYGRTLFNYEDAVLEAVS